MDTLPDPRSSTEDHAAAAAEGSLSAGESGAAVDVDSASRDANQVEVIIGEIPDVHDLSHMLWTARCTFLHHGMLGTFETRAAAEQAKQQHLQEQHQQITG